MSSRTFVAGVLVEEWNDATRTWTRYEGGQAVESRPYTAEEDAAADAAQAAEALAAAKVDLERQIALTAAPEALAEVQRLTLASEGVEPGGDWRQPQGAHDAYPKGWRTRHKDRLWDSTVDANVWEPGVSGWREFVEGGYPAYVQPTGAHDAYQTGDRVSFEGKCFESNRDGNVWSPAGLPSGWDEVPCP